MFAIFNQSEDADRRNEAPIIQVMGDRNKKQAAHISAEIVKLKKEMEPANKLDSKAVAEWEAALKAKAGRWYVLTPEKMTAVSGANFKAGSDGSILVSGKTAGTDDYTIFASSKLKKITAIKI